MGNAVAVRRRRWAREVSAAWPVGELVDAPPVPRATLAQLRLLARLPDRIERVGLDRRDGPFLVVPAARSRQRREQECKALLPAAAKAYASRAIGRATWEALVRRAEAEARDYHQAGLHQKSAAWLAAIEGARRDRSQRIAADQARWRAKMKEGKQEEIESFLSESFLSERGG